MSIHQPIKHRYVMRYNCVQIPDTYIIDDTSNNQEQKNLKYLQIFMINLAFQYS
jgi:hypothetical protein